MVKWFCYILFLICIVNPHTAVAHTHLLYVNENKVLAIVNFNDETDVNTIATDTTHIRRPQRQNRMDFVKKIKEIATAKNQPKPAKIETAADSAALRAKIKPPRQRRPEGMERPPEIPRRNSD